MLEVEIKLVPFGDKELKEKHLGRAVISNTGGSPTRGYYWVRLYDKAGRQWKSFIVEDFPRKKLLAWDLLYRALKIAVGERNE